MIGVAGLGYVGGTLAQALEDNNYTYVEYDPGKGFPDIKPLGGCDLIFVVVGTPEARGDLDNSAVQGVVGQLAQLCKKNTIIAIKSTVPPGTNDELADRYPQFRFASVPEFLVQDDAKQTFLNPDRIVIGTRDTKTAMEIAKVVCNITNTGQLVLVDPIEAELLKLSANVLLASKVAIANELSDICAAYGADWKKISRGAGLDHRIGPSHLRVTEERGFGGACFPKDLRGMISAAQRVGIPAEILEEIETYNKRIRRQALPQVNVVGIEARRGESA